MASHPNQSLFLSDAFSDVTFLVENQSIPGHKMLLAANCPYFKAMLFGATNESKMSTIELKNVSHKSFMEVLRCVYLRHVSISDWTPEEVKNLVEIADEYQFADMACVVADSIDVDTQLNTDVIQDVVGVASRLNCEPLMEKCAEFANRSTHEILNNEEAFDKLSMDFIIYLIEKKVWNPADARLVYAIGNWRKTASILDKKVLLSKIDWKSLPGKYSEPLVRMYLENDAEGLQVKDWTKGIKTPDTIRDLITGVYFSYGGTMHSGLGSLERKHVLGHDTANACVAIFFREAVTNVKKITFHYHSDALIDLMLIGENGETAIEARGGYDYKFDIPSNVYFWTIILNFQKHKYSLTSSSETNYHFMSKFQIICE